MQYLKNIDEFKKVVFSFFRDHDDVNAAEMSRMLAGMFSYFKDSEKDETDSAVSTIVNKCESNPVFFKETFLQYKPLPELLLANVHKVTPLFPVFPELYAPILKVP